MLEVNDEGRNRKQDVELVYTKLELKAHLEDFHKNGYCVVKGVLSPNEVRQVRSEIQKLGEIHNSIALSEFPDNGRLVYQGKSEFVIPSIDKPGRNQKVLKRIAWAGGFSPELLEISRAPKITQAALNLLSNENWAGESLQHLVNSVHLKNPGDNVAFSWHQDIRSRAKPDSPWNDINKIGSYVNCITAIDPFTNDNGSIEIISYEDVPEEIRYSNCMLNDKEKEIPLARYILNNKDKLAKKILLSPGDTAFFSPYVFHGSEANRSSIARWSIVNGFAIPGANSRKYVGEGAMKVVNAITGK